MLYRSEAFGRLTDAPWNDGRVRAAIRAIAADAERAYDPVRLWPADEWDAWTSPLPLKDLYVGAAGVIWALDELRRRGHADVRLDLATAATRALEAWRAEPDFPRGVELPRTPAAALLSGETGILLVAWRVRPHDEHADALHARVLENVGNEANELMWGSPGTMLAARAMHRWTGEERWAQAWRASADALWDDRDGDGLWTQRLYGAESRGLGPPHGVVGNVAALLDGGELLDRSRRDILRRDTSRVLGRAAVIEGRLANWPGDEGCPLEAADGQIRVQWCSGGPGVVTTAAEYLDEELLLAGAELVWAAGAHGPEKGSSICHGTAGNGYALLRMFGRTGDERWLERARRFVVHALEQVDLARRARGRGRYSLWTGDVGVALFAADCLDGRAAYPIVDSLRE